MKNMKNLCSGLFIALSVLFGQSALAQYPTKPIRLVVPFAAGGTVETVARIIAPGLGDSLGQTVVIEYKAGAATIVGADYVAKSAPDGYTLLLGTATTFSVNPILYKKLPYNEETSFTPIGIVGSTGLVLLANQNVQASTLAELLKSIKAKPNDFSYGSHGKGSTVHFAAEMLWSSAKVNVVHVPYKGGAPALTDLAAGQIPLGFDAIPAAAAAVKNGRIKPIAVTTSSRSPMFPDVPTIAESGFPGFKMESWFAIVGPSGLPSDIQQKLEKALATTLANKETLSKLATAGIAPGFQPPGAYLPLVRSDIAKLKPIAEKANMQQD